MKRIVADFLIGPHRKDRIARRLQCVAMPIAVSRLLKVLRFSSLCEMCGELLPDPSRHARPVVRHCGESGRQGRGRERH